MPATLESEILNSFDAAKREPDQRERVLGISFWNGSASGAVAEVASSGGCVVIPASPALLKLNYDESYRSALQQADIVLPDSELLALIWRMATSRPLRKTSGFEYLTSLLASAPFQQDRSALWIVSSELAKEKAVQWLQLHGHDLAGHSFRIVAAETLSAAPHALLLEIEKRQPRHVVIALRGAGQEQLGIYFRDYLLYRPAIHCVGAALGFLTGDEPRIPSWTRKFHLAWLARSASQPGLLFPRIIIALTVAGMIVRYRSQLPPLRARWSDL